jgi:hypothetical protein
MCRGLSCSCFLFQGPKSKLDSPADYKNALSSKEPMSLSKTANLVESLRITLSSHPVSWVKEFGPKGLILILEKLNDVYKNQYENKDR